MSAAENYPSNICEITSYLIDGGLNKGLYKFSFVMNNKYPKISCLMVTRGDTKIASNAIQCFQNQTYPNKELIIVTANKNGDLKRYVENLNDSRIKIKQVPSWTLGTLKNISCALAEGDLVAIWDDDDLYHHHRLEIQYQAICCGGAVASFLARLSLWQPSKKRLSYTHQRAWEGSMLVLKDHLPEYPAIGKSEDTQIMKKLVRSEKISLLDLPDLYLYVVHENNTWQKEHFDNFFTKSSTRFEGKEYENKINYFKSYYYSNEIIKNNRFFDF